MAELLLERQGILTREGVLAEGLPGGFSAIYSELTGLETLGTARRGYFVEGLGGAQFALPGAVERLRAQSERDAAPLVLSAVDPAQPYGAVLPWPAQRAGGARRPARTAGAYVVLAGGDPVLYVERGGRALQTLVGPEDARLEPALAGLVDRSAPRADQAPRSWSGSTVSRHSPRRSVRHSSPTGSKRVRGG